MGFDGSTIAGEKPPVAISNGCCGSAVGIAVGEVRSVAPQAPTGSRCDPQTPSERSCTLSEDFFGDCPPLTTTLNVVTWIL